MASDRSDRGHPFPRPVAAPRVPLWAPSELRDGRSGPEPPFLLDVRPPAERRCAHLDGDRAIPLAELPDRLAELPRDRTIVCYCQFGDRARQAARFLRGRGFARAVALEGGIDEYARRIDPTIPRYGAVGAEPIVLQEFPGIVAPRGARRGPGRPPPARRRSRGRCGPAERPLVSRSRCAGSGERGSFRWGISAAAAPPGRPGTPAVPCRRRWSASK